MIFGIVFVLFKKCFLCFVKTKKLKKNLEKEN